ncbi:hypothetical protein, partial [Aneurinibacillus aneurinilyticus]
IGLDGGFTLYSYTKNTLIEIDEFGLAGNPYRRKNGQYAKKPGRKPKPKAGIHGNSRNSPAVAALYAMYDDQAKFQKWGITQEVDDLTKRYGTELPKGWTVEELSRGSRSDMLDLEKELSEKNPGKLNKEKHAGSKIGEALSPKAQKIYERAGSPCPYS